MNIDWLVPLGVVLILALLYYWASARQERINRQRALRTQRENDAEALNKFGHGFGDWAVRQPRPQARDHDLERVPGYEDLWHCTACSCAEGTLPTQCPRVKVPPRVQDLIIKGVVDFVDGRWIGKRRNVFRIDLRFPAMGTTVEAFRNLSRAFAQAGRSFADFGRAAPPQVTAEMVREALAHVPFDLSNPERWEWLADFLNNAVRHPDVPCPCCNVTPAGDICDHLPPPPSPLERNDVKPDQ